MSESDFELEERLRQELRRVDAPEGFADRVMGMVASEAATQNKRRLVMMPRRTAWMAVAAMLLVGIVLGGWQWRQREIRERQQAEVARLQFELAMQVTGRTLAVVQERIGHAGEIQGRKREVEQ